MAQLEDGFFTGGDLAAEDISRCELENRGEAVDNALRRLASWEGGPAAAILLHLSPDNERVIGGEIVTRGTDAREITWEAAKIWPEADKRVTMTLVMPALDQFNFTGGSLTSELLDSTETVHFHHISREGRPPQPLLSGDLATRGVGNFCMRMVCTIAKLGEGRGAVGLKYYVMLFPEGREEMRARSELVARAEWPGVKLVDGTMPLLPVAGQPWGCPVLALLLPGQPFTAVARAPSSAAMREAISALMRTASAPEVSRNGASALAKWDKIVRNPASLVRKPTSLSWPAVKPAAPPATPAGKQSYNV